MPERFWLKDYLLTNGNFSLQDIEVMDVEQYNFYVAINLSLWAIKMQKNKQPGGI